jgi:hypothetical protein
MCAIESEATVAEDKQRRRRHTSARAQDAAKPGDEEAGQEGLLGLLSLTDAPKSEI